MKTEVLLDAPYEKVYERQKAEFNYRVDCRKRGEPLPEDLLLIVEHRPVLTLGRHGDKSNLLIQPASLHERGIDYFEIERGGDITFHGPGQLTVYPIIDLERYHLGVKDYVNLLEETVISTLKNFDIKGERIDGATGVWLDSGTAAERKISAIGIKCSRHVSMHGFALNVGNDISNFSLINPCGFKDKGVTSISRETGHEVDMMEVAGQLECEFKRLLQLRIPSQESF